MLTSVRRSFPTRGLLNKDLAPSMVEPPSSTWLPWLLFRFTLGVAFALVGLVLLGPFLDAGRSEPGVCSRVLALFAHDATLRRTALASALGLTVTACIFFRDCGTSGRGSKPPRLPPHSVGA
jgi:hypothetical protein